MPTYNYECKKCGYKFEKFQGITEDAVKICEKCNGEVRRLISSGAGIIFKGNGFYQTDYKASKDVDAPKPCEVTGKCPGSCEAAEK